MNDEEKDKFINCGSQLCKIEVYHRNANILNLINAACLKCLQIIILNDHDFNVEQIKIIVIMIFFHNQTSSYMWLADTWISTQG